MPYSIRNTSHPLLIHPLQLCFYACVLLIPEFWMLPTHPWWKIPVGIVANTIDYAVLGWVLCTVFAWLGKFWHKAEAVLHTLTHALVLCYSVSNLALLSLFHRHWDAFTLQLVRETNPREAMEFLGTYLFTPRMLLVFMALLLLMGLYLLSLRKTGRIRCLPQRPLWKWLSATFIAAIMSQAYFFIGSAEENYERAAGQPIKCNSLFNLRQSVLQMKEFEEENNQCARFLQQYDEDVTNQSDLRYMIVIIGESFNRHHSSLYGYSLPTNPRLGRLRDEGRLWTFHNVIAPCNSTTFSFKYFLSTASVNDSLNWNEAPLLPAVMRKAGWNTVYYSNQFSDEEDLKQWDASMGFINHPRISPHLFDRRNHRTYDYDMQLVDDYRNHRKQLETDGRNLIIFHLMGQHVNFNQRFPQDETIFRACDVPRPSLPEAQRQCIADYDNATLYNDKVVDRIIRMFEKEDAAVLYFSDHGEEVYDYRNQMGRSDLDMDHAPMTLRNQLDIPLMIYLSPCCERQRPSLKERIKDACRKPFMIDDLPHLVLDMAGIHTKWLHTDKSPISPSYPTHKHRLFIGGHDYDLIMQQ